MRLSILRDKINLRKLDLGIVNPITYEEWTSIIESIDELVWYDDTEPGKNFYKDKNDTYRRKNSCLYKYNPDTGHVEITFMWKERGYISVDSEIRKMDFVFYIADKFEGRIFNIQKEVFRK